jgi:hypothetical protein
MSCTAQFGAVSNALMHSRWTGCDKCRKNWRMRETSPRLTESEWDDLLDLIAESPAERLNHAFTRVGATRHVATKHQHPFELAAQPRTVEGWLIYLASISSGDTFDRALLAELRRLRLH